MFERYLGLVWCRALWVLRSLRGSTLGLGFERGAAQSGAGSVGGSAHVPSVHRTELSGSLGGLARSPVVRNRGTKKASETNEGEWISRTRHWFRGLYRFRSLGEVRVALVRIAAKSVGAMAGMCCENELPIGAD